MDNQTTQLLALKEQVNRQNWRLLRAANIDRNAQCYPQCANQSPWDWAMMVYGEMGEFINAHRKFWDPSRHSKLTDELADVVISCDILANSVGYDLSTCKLISPHWWGTSTGRKGIGDPQLTEYALRGFMSASKDLSDVQAKPGICAICAVMGVLRAVREVADHLNVQVVTAVPDKFNRRSSEIGYKAILDLSDLPVSVP